MSKIGGMQRVGIDLLQQLDAHPDVDVETVILRSATRKRLCAVRAVPVSCIHHRACHDEAGRELMPCCSRQCRRLFLPRSWAAHHEKPGYRLPPSRTGMTSLQIQAPISGSSRGCLPGWTPCCRSAGPQGGNVSERGLPLDRLFVTPNGIEPDRFGDSFPGVLTTRSDRRAVLATAFPALADKIGPDDLLLCSVGRQVKRKGHEWFIRNVMPQLARNVHLALGGKGPQSEAIRQATLDTGLDDRVHSLGLVAEEDLASLYSGGDLFVMPNVPVDGDIEGFGVVMLEAGLCGMPSIASRIEGIQDVITDGVNGYCVDALDVDGFADIINRYAAAPDSLDKLSETSRSHTIETFAWPTVCAQIVATLKKVIHRKKVIGD